MDVSNQMWQIKMSEWHIFNVQHCVFVYKKSNRNIYQEENNWETLHMSVLEFIEQADNDHKNDI